MSRDDLSKNLVISFFPDLEHKMGKIFKSVKRIAGSFERGNVRYQVAPKGETTPSANSVYEELIELYLPYCEVDADKSEGIIDGLYVTCEEGNKVFIMIDLSNDRLSVSAWVRG